MYSRTNENHVELVQKARSARRSSKVSKDASSKVLWIMVFGIMFWLVYMYVNAQLMQSSMQLAKSQQTYKIRYNQQQILIQDSAVLKDPARIGRLAMELGMTPPSDNRLAQVYAAPWSVELKPAVATQAGKNARLDNTKLSFWTKLFSFTSQAEAKTSNP